MTTTATGGDRVITGRQMRGARTWATEHRGYLEAFSCTERVLAVTGVLITEPDGQYDSADLMAALREQDTIDVTLDLLTDLGLGCGDG
jgi:hypothetical protein